MPPKLLSRLSFLLLLVSGFNGLAQAGLFDDEEARRAILDLRQRIEQRAESVRLDAEKRVAEETKRATEDTSQLRRSLVDLQNQIEVLRANLAKLQGVNEQLAREVSEFQRRQKDVAQSLDERIRKFEPLKVTVDGKEFLAEPTEKREFDAAMVLFRKGEFAAVQGAFVDFLKRYPQSGYAASTLFWLGNAQYATRDYKEAVVNFRGMLSQAPDHLRAPEAVLAIANCQIELKDTRAARKTLEDLIKAYPQAEATVAAKDRLARLR